MESGGAAAAFAVLTDRALWRTITSLMSGWPFPVFHVWSQRVLTYKLHAPRWGGEALSFPQKRGAIAHVAIIENNQRALEIAYELSKLPRKPVIEFGHVKHDRAQEALSFKHVMACAARYGRLEMLQWMLEKANSERIWWVWEEDLIQHALSQRDLVVMGFLRDEFPAESTKVSYQFLLQVAEDNDMVMIKWYHEHGYQFHSDDANEFRNVMDHASSLEMLQFLNAAPGIRCSSRAMDRAADLGDCTMVTFLHENRREGCTVHAMNAAAAKGCIDIVRFLHENRIEGCTVQAMDLAAGNGHLEVVRFLDENRTEGCTTKAMDSAAANGHLEVVQFLHEYRSEGCTKKAMDAAVNRRHLDVARFLRDNRTEGDYFEVNEQFRLVESIENGSRRLGDRHGSASRQTRWD